LYGLRLRGARSPGRISVTDPNAPFRTSPFDRLLSTARLAGSALRIGSRKALGRSDHSTDAALGDAIVAEMDRMKGMAMKVGQILSYFDGVLPLGTHEALRVLQQGTARMPEQQVRRILRDELGGEVEMLFDAFDAEPVAAASIGQVHRAVFEGRAVAVKIQYPHVRDTIDADFGRVEVLSRLASAATRVDGPAIARELRERVREECDYLAEAEAQKAFRDAWAQDEEVRIPEALPERSSARVLTTEWCEGGDLYAFIARSPPEQRNAVARVLLRFAYRSFFELETVNADPHPGNYLFPDRTPPVVFLDFGSVKQFSPGFVASERRIARAVLGGDRREFRAAVLEAGMVADGDGFDWRTHWEMLRHQYSPYLPGRFRFHDGLHEAGAGVVESVQSEPAASDVPPGVDLAPAPAMGPSCRSHAARGRG
jgi:predicted unusual protein kinase regulating ubiquinone biosynthesis (AarF/ABC1/UbiB family)